MKTIALFTTSFPASPTDSRNAGVFVKEFAQVLSERGYRVVVLTPYKAGATNTFEFGETYFFGWLGESHSLTHISFQSLHGAVQLFSMFVSGVYHALKVFVKEKPSLILCFWIFPCGFWAWFLHWIFGVPYSVWALGSDIWVLARVPLLRQLMKWILQGSRQQYADGFQLLEDMNTIFSVTGTFLASSRKLTVCQGIEPRSGGYYAYIGRYHPHKGPDLLLEAVKRVESKLPADFRLKMFGYGPLKDDLIHFVEAHHLEKKVEIHGATDLEQMEVILQETQGVIIPSRLESIPIILSDAAQMDVPLLVTDVGDMGRVVREHRAGWVTSPQPEALAQALLQWVQSQGNRDVSSLSLAEFLSLDRSVERFLADHQTEC